MLWVCVRKAAAWKICCVVAHLEKCGEVSVGHFIEFLSHVLLLGGGAWLSCRCYWGHVHCLRRIRRHVHCHCHCHFDVIAIAIPTIYVVLIQGFFPPLFPPLLSQPLLLLLIWQPPNAEEKHCINRPNDSDDEASEPFLYRVKFVGLGEVRLDNSC